MAEDAHTEDLRTVHEGDTVEIVTSENEAFEAKCVEKEIYNADPRTGEVRETRSWHFDAVEHQPVVTIIDGLRSSPDDPEFPIHKSMWDSQQEGSMGYINDLTICGES
jgi:hypothetical protein